MDFLFLMILAESMNSSHNHLLVVVSGACSVRCLGGAPSRGLEQHVMSHPLVFSLLFFFLLNHLDLEADKLHPGALEWPSRMGEVTNYFLRGLVRMCMCAQSLSCVQHFATPWTVTCHAPLSVGFPRQEYCSGLPFHSSGNLPNPGMEPMSPAVT